MNCWLWERGCTTAGYASLRINGKQVLIHRWMYEQLVGPIPEGTELDHLCRVRHCVNPDHLEAVTHQENMQRGWWGMRTHCPQGHEYTEANTYHTLSGHRRCRRCNADRAQTLRDLERA